MTFVIPPTSLSIVKKLTVFGERLERGKIKSDDVGGEKEGVAA